MSSSLLYHMFGIWQVQYLKTNFLTAKPSFMQRFIPTQ